MEHLHPKKIMILFSVSFLLFSCTEELEVNQAIISEAFDKLTINHDLMIANDRIDNPDDPHYDLTEMIDATNKQAIYIFTTLYDENTSKNEEKFFYITPEYIYLYFNKEMDRSANPFDSNNENYYRDILDTYTISFDLTWLSITALKDFAFALEQPSLTKNNDEYTLKGMAEPPAPLASGEIFENEFIYTATELLQFSKNHRHDYASTWQKSNFISGIDYFFGISSIPEFPSISEFGY